MELISNGAFPREFGEGGVRSLSDRLERYGAGPYYYLFMLRWHTSPQRTKANELGAEVLLAIRRESGKSLGWLLTGEE
jgi:hypothetical protein